MDSGLFTMMKGYPGHFGARRQLYPNPDRNPWCPG